MARRLAIDMLKDAPCLLDSACKIALFNLEFGANVEKMHSHRLALMHREEKAEVGGESDERATRKKRRLMAGRIKSLLKRKRKTLNQSPIVQASAAVSGQLSS